ncbi:MAG: rod shape-determining protein MreD [Prevotella sp.]
MAIDIGKKMLLLLALCLTQALVLNRIHLFDCTTPLLYVYMIIIFPYRYPRWGIILWSFFLGLVIDIFSNTPGVASASLTLVGAIQPGFFSLFVQRDAQENIAPGVFSMGFFKFTFYAFVLVLLHCLLFFTLETFSFFNVIQWLKCIGGSTAITLILVLTIESLRKK